MLEKFQGVIVGSALGDAIGKSLEDITKEQALEYYGGRVEGFVEPHPHSPAYGLRPEDTSDETTISMILCESILSKKMIDPYDFFYRLLEFRKDELKHRQTDPTLLRAIDLLSSGISLEDAGCYSFSVEGILRCSVVGLYHYYNPYLASEGGRLVSLITHRSPEIYDASGAYSALISLLILESYDLSRQEDRLNLLEHLKVFMKREKSKKFIDTVIQLLKEGKSLEDAIAILGNSTYVFESFPLALFIFLSNIGNPMEAFWQAVNACGDFGGDTDSIGYLVGSMVGAYYGLYVFPEDLVVNLERSEYYINISQKLYELVVEQRERR
ncbi:ADP-ribosylglycohydrolase family protein [Thermocrinis minervae]|uniref:ADP-ribosylglycohydrolase n=1 Tax=Thermocrinis minervae TaxID=381751 RepID=A0A1M6QMH4_9AQUI|nr:ADP-ribosylglycohydrolase family protein [Thermocrinis minervae]SHK21416.1 ADP-ribosylglycohydrolase [Thermocrinis minervae]